VLQDSNWSWGEQLASSDPVYLQATTACLGTIILMQVFNVFLCKTPERSLFGASNFTNHLLLWGVAFEVTIILAIVYTPWGHVIFGTAPIALSVWLFMLPCGVGMLLLEEARKWVVVRWRLNHD
jgi:magnesium-transporting ATPase (P-type)